MERLSGSSQLSQHAIAEAVKARRTVAVDSFIPGGDVRVWIENTESKPGWLDAWDEKRAGRRVWE
jgi:hypothetical protein